MRKEIKIRLTNKDGAVKVWWDLASKRGYNISKTIKYIVDIYITRGVYIDVATVKNIPLDKEYIRKISIDDETDTYKWLLERQAKGEPISSAIKRVLRNSIKEGSIETLLEEDEIVRLSEQKIYQISSGVQRENESAPKEEYIPKIQSIPDIPKETDEEMKPISLDEESDTDLGDMLFDKMIGASISL